MCPVHYICTGAHRDQKRPLDSLRLELKLWVAMWVLGATLILCKSNKHSYQLSQLPKSPFLLLFFVVFTCALFWDSIPLLSWLAWNSLCTPHWPWAHRDPPASTFRVLTLKACTIGLLFGGAWLVGLGGLFCFLFFVFETQPEYVAQANLKLTILLSQGWHV